MSEKSNKAQKYTKPKKVLKPLKDKPLEPPSRQSMMLVENVSGSLSKKCDFVPNKRGSYKQLNG